VQYLSIPSAAMTDGSLYHDIHICKLKSEKKNKRRKLLITVNSNTKISVVLCTIQGVPIKNASSLLIAVLTNKQ